MRTPDRHPSTPLTGAVRRLAFVAGRAGDGALTRPEALPRPRTRAQAVLVLARPRQWVKNALVVAAAGAAGALGRDGVPVRVGFAAVAFCLLSAGIYALNDVRDVEEDRRHPRKRRRPVAAGELARREASILGLAWLAGGLLLSLAISPLLALVATGYLALTLSYTWLWRRVIVLDIVVVAGGFVLRALAGGVAAPVALSRWFVLVVTGAAVFLAAGKRHAELLRTGSVADGSAQGRQVIRRYSPGMLRLLLSGSGAVALFAYYVWTFQPPDVDDMPWRLLTAVPFTICLLRYGSLIRAGEGEAPEELLLSDSVLVLSALTWLILFALNVHATG